MMKWFDATDEIVKEMQNDLSGIGQKVDAHAVSIKQLEQEMNQLSTTVNPRCMAVTTRGGKQTIDPPMSSKVETVEEKDDDEIEVVGESKEVERLVKKNEEGKYRRFITMLKQLSINVPLIEALEKMPGYIKFMKDLVTKKRAVSFKDDDRLQHCSAIATRSLVQKKEDPGAFTIPCTIGLLHFAKVLCDLGASINLLPLSIYKKLGIGAPKLTAMRLLMADRTVKKPIGVL
ncbi:uncharacterized protein LOC125813084 [Solanum verrucosum]|uniref:uncharacterized protein LOC125813084 n=1 Tax=Solanum verrucosum TaxID=315347 RepID=UPI0020D05F7C|nr:uncharacterized protein LOC125813084 [Solanum verrucosum]